MNQVTFAAAFATGLGAVAAQAAVAPEYARDARIAPAGGAATELAQGGGTVLPPQARCPRQPPSQRHVQNPYVIWICQQAGGRQFDYYLGTGYLYSLIVPG